MLKILRTTWQRLIGEDANQTNATLSGLLVLAVGMGLSIAYSSAVANQNRTDEQFRISQDAQAIATSLREKMTSYESAITAGAAFVSLQKEPITSASWKAFVEGLRIQEKFPNTLGIGYTTYLKPEEVPTFEAQMQTQMNDFKVRPVSPRNEYTAITFLEPMNEVNRKALGYDMFSETNRQTAMKVARDRATVGIAKPVPLVQDLGTINEDNPGVLLYYPTYSTSVPPKSLEERRIEIQGYAYAALRPNDIVKEIEGAVQLATNPSYRIVDISNGEETQLFSNLPGGKQPTNQLSESENFSIGNRTWQIQLFSPGSFLKSRVTPTLLFLVGAFLSGTAAYLVWSSTLKHMRKTQMEYETEIQRTKDELLAIASHQLRTPASGVKQYIGMLTQGFVGELTPEQHEIASKAFIANERQLEIINELLYVAKADAGQLIMQPEDLDFVELVRDTIAAVSDKAVAKNITIHFRNKRPVFIDGDNRYLRMIIENLLTNAIKYSYASSPVQVKLTIEAKHINLAVKDSGVGMSDEDMKTIFQKFERAENPLSRVEGGSGLGLFLARELARAHHGTIRVSSAIEKGSTFTLRLPLKQPNHQKTKGIANLGHAPSEVKK